MAVTPSLLAPRLRTLLSLSAASSLALLLGPGCGARAELAGLEPCLVEGTVRLCGTRCGTGTQLCSGSYWLPCDVPPRTEACTNTCGTGRRTCSNDMLGPCEVDPVQKPCKSACGEGLAWCRDNLTWLCETPPPVPVLRQRLWFRYPDLRKGQVEPVRRPRGDKGMHRRLRHWPADLCNEPLGEVRGGSNGANL